MNFEEKENKQTNRPTLPHSDLYPKQTLLLGLTMASAKHKS